MPRAVPSSGRALPSSRLSYGAKQRAAAGVEPEATSGTECGEDSQQVALEFADTRNYGAGRERRHGRSEITPDRSFIQHHLKATAC